VSTLARYDEDDIVTYWFVVNKTKYETKQIQAWSDNKELIKFYMEFHNCKRFELVKMTNTMKEIMKVIEENVHDEVMLCNINTRDPKNKNKIKMIQIPATATEMNYIREESTDFMLSHIHYSYLESVVPYLKDKYKYALKNTLLLDVIKKVIYNQSSPSLEYLGVDQLKIMINLFPDNFR
jgi:hypothetical protein